jgi:hypothetical protein
MAKFLLDLVLNDDDVHFFKVIFTTIKKLKNHLLKLKLHIRSKKQILWLKPFQKSA